MRALIVVIGMLLLPGCSVLVSKVQEDIERKSAERAAHELRDLKFKVHDERRVLACIEAAGGQCPDPAARKATSLVFRELATAKAGLMLEIANDPKAAAGARAAARAMASPVTTHIESFLRSNFSAGPRTVPMHFTQRDLSRFSRDVQEATSLDGWSQLKAMAKSRQSGTAGAPTTALDLATSQLDLVQAYLDAYFNGGRFVTVDVDTSKVRGAAIDALKRQNMSENDAAKLVDGVFERLAGSAADSNGNYHLISKEEDGGFVTRGGTRYAFVGVTITVAPKAKNEIEVSKVDFTQVGADVVRVFIEALGDEWARLPAAKNSTACAKAPALCYDEAAPRENVKISEFGKVNEWSNRSEALAATATGRAIRGASWLSLNNEALAKIIETAVGVAVRKVAEKAAWCYFECGTPEGKEDFRAVSITVSE